MARSNLVVGVAVAGGTLRRRSCWRTRPRACSLRPPPGLAYTNRLCPYPLTERDSLLRQRRCAAALAKRLASHTGQRAAMNVRRLATSNFKSGSNRPQPKARRVETHSRIAPTRCGLDRFRFGSYVTRSQAPRPTAPPRPSHAAYFRIRAECCRPPRCNPGRSRCRPIRSCGVL